MMHAACARDGAHNRQWTPFPFLAPLPACVSRKQACRASTADRRILLSRVKPKERDGPLILRSKVLKTVLFVHAT
jgi:hypothetical protein